MARKHFVVHEQINNILKFMALVEKRPEVAVAEEAIYWFASERAEEIEDKHHKAALKGFCKLYREDQ